MGLTVRLLVAALLLAGCAAGTEDSRPTPSPTPSPTPATVPLRDLLVGPENVPYKLTRVDVPLPKEDPSRGCGLAPDPVETAIARYDAQGHPGVMAETAMRYATVGDATRAFAAIGHPRCATYSGPGPKGEPARYRKATRPAERIGDGAVYTRTVISVEGGPFRPLGSGLLFRAADVIVQISGPEELLPAFARLALEKLRAGRPVTGAGS